MNQKEKWDLLSHLIAESIGEILKEHSDYEYDIKLTKQNEKIAKDGVSEFDVMVNLYVKPLKMLGVIENRITILKSGEIEN